MAESAINIAIGETAAATGIGGAVENACPNIARSSNRALRQTKSAARSNEAEGMRPGGIGYERVAALVKRVIPASMAAIAAALFSPRP